MNPAVSWASVAASGPVTVAMTLASAAAGLTVARGQASFVQAIELTVRIPLQAAALGVIMWADMASGPALASATALGSFAFGGTLLARLPWKTGVQPPLPSAIRPLLNRFITTASLNAVLFTLLSSMSVLLGSRLVPAETIAPLGIALRISGALAMLHASVFDYHAAAIARSIRGASKDKIPSGYLTVAAESTALTILTMLALVSAVVIAPVDLPPNYAESIAPLWILLGTRLVSGGIGPAPAVMTITGGHAALAAATAAGIAAETFTILAVAKPLGASGLAIGSGVGTCTYCIITRLLLTRDLKSRTIIR
jgi:hypothetical protein